MAMGAQYMPPQAAAPFQPGAHPSIVRVRNESEQPFPIEYLNQLFVIPALGETIMPWDVMVEVMGNPNAFDVDRHKDRTREMTRLRVRAGAYHDNEEWEAVKPRLTAWDANTGERIVTVLDDPAGDQSMPTRATAATQHALEGQVAQLQAQLSTLMAAAAQNGFSMPTQAPSGPLLAPSGAPVTPPVVDAVPPSGEPSNPLIPDGPAASLPELIVPQQAPGGVGTDAPVRLPVSPGA